MASALSEIVLVSSIILSKASSFFLVASSTFLAYSLSNSAKSLSYCDVELSAGVKDTGFGLTMLPFLSRS